MPGKKSKQGKARKDKFYFLSKQSGFRSRAAFKLIQINRKFNFLKSSRVLIDLCAAPGSWLQVAAHEMPVSSVILGFDLVPIQPIPNVKTFQEDITSDKCRQIIKKELQTWKADCILHDGAPNVGKAWLHDEYQQAELSLHSFAIATQFLRKGGVFVTKVFRSRDYEPLKWVLSQFFHNIKAMKPEASRLESAEIYLVCLRYKEPDNIDPKFLNPKYVFKDAVIEKPKIKHIAQIQVTGKKKAVGYEEDDWKYQKISVMEFLKSDDFLLLLSKANEIDIDSPEVLDSPRTTDEVKACCKDIKACGRPELRALVSWRKYLLKDMNKEKSNEVEETKEDSEEKPDAELVEEEISRLYKEERKEKKKKLKKVREEKKKLTERMQLKMHHPDDQIEQTDDIELFSLSHIHKNGGRKGGTENEIALESLDSLIKEEDDRQPAAKRRKVTFQKDSDLQAAAEEDENIDEDEDDDDYDFDFEGDSNEEEEEEDSNEEEEEEEDLNEEEEEEEDSNEEEEESDDSEEAASGSGGENISVDEETVHVEDEANPLLVDWQSSEQRADARVEAWYEKDIFKDSDDDDESSSDDEEIENEEVKGFASNKVKRTTGVGAQSWQDGSTLQSDAQSKSERRRAKKEEKRKAKVVKLSAEELALGEAMANSRRQQREIEEGAFHRYTGFGDGAENLPGWFVQDERRHMRRPLPVSRERVAEYRKREEAVDTRTIRKVAEARARKRAKSQKRLDRVRKKADTITNEEGMPDTEKWGKIKQLYKKAGFLGQKKRAVKYVVSSRSGSRPTRSSKAKKGQPTVTKVVDKRLKADTRGMKSKERRKQGRGGRAAGRGKKR